MDLVGALAGGGSGRGDFVGLTVGPTGAVGMATVGGSWSFAGGDLCAAVREAEGVLRPRWVLWSKETAAHLVRAGARLALAWDVAAVHRLVFGDWVAGPDRVWAAANGLAIDAVPTMAPADLFSSVDDGGGGDLQGPVRTDGYLCPEWVAGGWHATPERLACWAALAVRMAAHQRAQLDAIGDRAAVTARCESGAELLCAEMTVDGLPVDRSVAMEIIADFVGPRPGSATEAAATRARRDADVLRHAGPGADIDLRSTAQVKTLLARLGLEVTDTRAWRLRALQDRHPFVPALLAWRKAERIATTYGYAWLDEHLGTDGRLRGTWTGCDGAAGRMTASGGLHNMPAELRPAVMAEPGQIFVRADLGQVEPRVLAAVSGDEALTEATLGDDLYAPVAAQLGVDRATAKVAVLGAMYGQTTGHGAQALRRLEVGYPVAMTYLDRAARAAEAGRDVRTHGGRLVRMGAANPGDGAASEARAAVAARGRYGRNAVIQGAAAELFKAWAVTVRARIERLGARIVLCLHDELLVQAPREHGEVAARLLSDCLDEAVRLWAPSTSVRFVADVSLIVRWSDAKSVASSEQTVASPRER